MGKRGTEIWGGGGEKQKGGGRVGAKIQWNMDQNLGLGMGVCSPRNKLAQSSFKLIFQIEVTIVLHAENNGFSHRKLCGPICVLQAIIDLLILAYGALKSVCVQVRAYLWMVGDPKWVLLWGN